MPTEKQIFASRANGAKSCGPVTPEGKLRVSQNARTHGLCAAALTIDGEETEALEHLRASLFADFNPTTPKEVELVEYAVHAIWRRNRLWQLETNVLNDAIREQAEGLPAQRAARAFAKLANETRALDVLHRYDSRFERHYHRALHKLQKAREESENKNLPSEPGEHLTPAESTHKTNPIC